MTTELNTIEYRPPHMDDSGRTKYPVLFRVYGGPASQTVDTRFGRDWHAYLACAMDYVVVAVDGRGTGFKGRKFRNWVKGDLGFWETKDQVSAAKVWAAREYVDPKRIGIWGWVSCRAGAGRLSRVSHAVFAVVWRVHELEGDRGGCRGALARDGHCRE
jgi:dipeptidyl aminopeptidase/acylaminoacyl peptidase